MAAFLVSMDDIAVGVLVVGAVFYLIFVNRKKSKGCKGCKSDLHQ
jgi:hypothetical protein